MSNKARGDTKLFELRFIVSSPLILCLLHGITPADELQTYWQINPLMQTCKVLYKYSAAKDFRAFFVDRSCLFVD